MSGDLDRGRPAIRAHEGTKRESINLIWKIVGSGCSLLVCILCVIGFLVTCAPLSYCQASSSDDIQGLNREAKAAAERDDLNQAAALYKRIVKLDPTLAEVWANLGVIYYSQRNYEEAEQAFERALRLKPSLTQPKIFLGVTQAELGRCELATPLLKESLAKSHAPELDRLIGLHLLGCYSALKDISKAEEVLIRLRHEFPSDPDILYTAAKFYSDLSAEALSALQQAAPDSYRFHQFAGEVMESQGNYARAEAHFRAALERRPDIPGVHYELGKMIVMQSREGAARERAQKEFEAELVVNPRSAAAEYQLALLALQSDRVEEAKQRFRRAVEVDAGFGDAADAYVGLGKIFLKWGNLQEAIANFEKAKSVDPNNVAAHYLLANVLRRVGRRDEAEREASIFRTLSARTKVQRKSPLEEYDQRPAETQLDEGEKTPPK